MDTSRAISVFESLASGVRLDIFRLLVRTGPEGLVAGDIAARLGLPANNTSFHLKTLVHSGLLTVEQQGRFQRFRANLALMSALVHYLTAECCAGQPDICPEIPSPVCCE